MCSSRWTQVRGLKLVERWKCTKSVIELYVCRTLNIKLKSTEWIILSSRPIISHIPTAGQNFRTNRFRLLFWKSLHKRSIQKRVYSTIFSRTAVPWLRRLVAGLSPRRPGFDPRSSPCEIYGGQSGTGTGFSPSCRFPLSISFHWCSINCENW